MYVQQIISNVRFRVFNEIQFLFHISNSTNPKKMLYLYIRKSKEDEEKAGMVFVSNVNVRVR